MNSIIENKYIHIDSLKILTAFITLHGLLGESIITEYIYIDYFQKPMFFFIGVFFILAYIQNASYIKNIYVLMFPLLVGVYTAEYLYGYNFILLFLLMFFCQENKVTQIITTIYQVARAFFWFLFVLFFVSLILPIGLNDYTINTVDGIRYSFFTYHPNTFARIFIFVIALSCFVNNLEMSIRRWICIWLLTGIIYYYTKSDALYLIGVCFLLSMVKNNNIVEKVLYFLTKFGVPFLVFFSLSLALTANIPFLYQKIQVLSELMSGRLGSNLRALALYGPTFWGQESEFGAHFVFHGVSYDWVYADNMYVYMIVHWGIVYLVLMTLLLLATADKLDYKAKMMVGIYLLYGLGENFTTMIYVSFPLLIAYSVINKDDGERLLLYVDERKMGKR